MIHSNFMRLHNPDSTSDVICLNCFQTIAISQEQFGLASAESNHLCSPSDLILQHYGSSYGGRTDEMVRENWTMV